MHSVVTIVPVHLSWFFWLKLIVRWFLEVQKKLGSHSFPSQFLLLSATMLIDMLSIQFWFIVFISAIVITLEKKKTRKHNKVRYTILMCCVLFKLANSK